MNVQPSQVDEKIQEMGETLDLAGDGVIDVARGNNDSLNMRAEDTQQQEGISQMREDPGTSQQQDGGVAGDDERKAYCSSELELLRRINEKLRVKVSRQNEAIDTVLAHKVMDRSQEILRDPSYTRLIEE